MLRLLNIVGKEEAAFNLKRIGNSFNYKAKEYII